MFSWHKNCLFCFKALPELDQRKGEGEHIIPKNIYGFWKSYDICSECKEYFGKNIDILSLKNPNLLNAIKELKLPYADTVFDNISYSARDTIDNRSIKMVRKKGKFRIKVSQIRNNFFECAEKDWEKIGLDWIRNTTPVSISSEIVEKEICKLKGEYDKIKPGEEIHSEIFGKTIRKKQITNIQVDPNSFSPITPLIAKIAVCFLRYAYPDEVNYIDKYEMLRQHARYGKPINDHVINWFPSRVKTVYDRWHRITLEPYGRTLLIDITLFGYPNWRVIATSEDKLSVTYRNGQPVQMLYLVLDFSDFKDKKKYLGFKYKDNSQIEWWDLFM